jgi:Transposase DDE domain group 1
MSPGSNDASQSAPLVVRECALRRIGLRHTQFSEATCGTLRLRLLKIGALVKISCRRIKLAMASAFPCQQEYALAHVRLARAAF